MGHDSWGACYLTIMNRVYFNLVKSILEMKINGLKEHGSYYGLLWEMVPGQGGWSRAIYLN